MLAQVLMVSAVVMGISQTLTRERIFAAFRNRCGGHETWLGYLVSCPYCASHYVAFALVPLTATYPLKASVPWGWLSTVLTWFLSSILITVVAAFMRMGFWFMDETQGLVRRRQGTEERKAQLLARRAEEDQGKSNGGSDSSSPDMRSSVRGAEAGSSRARSERDSRFNGS